MAIKITITIKIQIFKVSEGSSTVFAITVENGATESLSVSRKRGTNKTS